MLETLASNIVFNLIILLISFYFLYKSAEIFVESAVVIADYLRIPKIILGIIVVGFATTAPEIAVSAQSSFLGHPEIAFGNAIGSVICDDGVALALGAIVAPTAILINKRVLNTTGIFLIFIDIVAFFFAINGYISRIEGGILFIFLIGYLIFIYISEKKNRLNLIKSELEEIEPKEKEKSKKKFVRYVIYFLLSLIGVIAVSRVIIWSSVNIAKLFKVSETLIGLTIIAIGTSLPEISTAIIASLKGHGEISAGNIIGADILNILWIIGVSSMIQPIVLDVKTVYFAFGWMFLIVGTMLILMRIGYKLTRWKGIVLFLLYIAYIIFNLKIYYFPF